MAPSILVLEDDAHTARNFERALGTGGTFRIVCSDTVGDGLRVLATRSIDCVLLDYRLPDGDGLEVLRTIRRDQPSLPVVMITGTGCEEVAVEAMKLGAVDYVVKHGEYLDGLPTIVRAALGQGTLRRAAIDPDRPLDSPSSDLRERCRACGIVGISAALEHAVALAGRAAGTNVPVLLEGESGTGKELFARAIHALGERAQGPFVPVNCAAVPEQLLEGELFGHVRGAFSGAERDRRGLFEEAHGGTLFLDEIGDLPLDIQAKLLRVLHDRAVRRLGANRSIDVDARIIAAANQDLASAVINGRFRLDLYHRVHVFPIRLPALRERQGDIPLLAARFVDRFSQQEGIPPAHLDQAVVQAFEQYPWPGNVRELENEICRLVLCTEPGERIGLEMVASRIRAATDGVATRPRALRQIVRDVELATIAARLREHGYSRTATARSLGITREGLWQKLRRLGLSAPDRGSSRD